MKLKNTIILASIALTSSSLAGDSYSAKSSKSVITPPIIIEQEECRLHWFIATSAGYLSDESEAMYHFQVGLEHKENSYSNALYLEVGYTSFDLTIPFNIAGDVSTDRVTDTEIIPITLNYKYERNFNQNLKWYIGAGAGVALVKQDFSLPGFPINSSDEDAVFYAQAFAGIIYDFTPNFEIFGGARYIIMDDPELDGGADLGSGSPASIDENILIELGARYTF